ncbi:hypothetical protein RND81_04G246800 [Saponaria officinalis]|uniref:Late embryogenesis abundant protein LEA-2 subgroup domain-containing protein n=1 Tax=Saponaria officinalis TaxID=3572 RepID=A0AAW1LQC1_SAPOF
MAERATQSNNEGLYVDDEESNDLIRRNNNNKKDELMQIFPSHGTSPIATYIVQIPRDQIYRVPPPENAKIVQRYSNPVQNAQQGGRRRRCAYWFLSILFGVAFIISVIVCVHKFTLSPKPPSFSVTHVLLKHNKNASPVFQVSMETMNPNIVNDVGYKQGSVRLSYKGKQIGKGHFPAFANLAPGKSNPVDMTLLGSTLPNDFDNRKSRSNKANKTLNMELSMNIPVNMKTWLWTNSLDLDVKCDFEAESTGSDHFQIESQNCHVTHTN